MTSFVDDTIKLVKTNDFETFKENVENGEDEDLNSISENIWNLFIKLNDFEKRRVIQWYKDIKIYIIHDVLKDITKTKLTESDFRWLEFLKNDELYKKHYLIDNKGRTWIHTVVITEEEKLDDLLNYLVKEIKIDVKIKDNYGYTALHYACERGTRTESEIKILINQSNYLLYETSGDVVTPLELACADIEKLGTLINTKEIKLKDILIKVDNVSKGLPVTYEKYIFNNSSVTDTWINILLTNNKYKLIYCMTNDSKFNEKYYIDSINLYEIFSKCGENGQGIITYLKSKKCTENSKKMCEELFEELTGFQIDSIKETKKVFYKSALFLALITGRLELVPLLLMYCQFNIILYGLLTCAICQKLYTVKEFSEKVLEKLLSVKTFCEKYSIAVLNKTAVRDLTKDKKIILEFLKEPDVLINRSVLDIAYLCGCSKFLSFPICQLSISAQWYERGKRCPAVKFYLHSINHCIFLIIFSYILVSNFFAKMSISEIYCYCYGAGYLFEEIRQIVSYSNNGMSAVYVKDPTNYFDISASLFLIAAVLLKLFYPLQVMTDTESESLLIETNDINLFFIKLLLCFSYIVFFMRVIYFGFIFKELGPKLKMISRMIVTDLLPLIYIFLIFIISFGVSFQTILYSNRNIMGYSNITSKEMPTETIIANIFGKGTFTIFDAHYCLDEIESSENEYKMNEKGKFAIYILLFIYILIVNVLLTNLLIALFSNTVTIITSKANESWKASRYKKIKEYLYHSLLPPPFNVLETLIEITIHLFKKFPLITNCVQHTRVEDDDKYELYIVQFMPFKILQAFAVRDSRYTLIRTEEDKEHERKYIIKYLRNQLAEIETYTNKINEELKKKGINIELV